MLSGLLLLVGLLAALVLRRLFEDDMPAKRLLDGAASAWLASGIVALTFALFAFTRMAPDMVALLGMTLLLLCGVLTPEQAFIGFANEGVITIGALYVVVAGLRETGAVGWIGRRLLGRPSGLRAAQIRLMAPVAFLSAFLNNTPLVAMMLPAVSDWAKRFELPPSKLMIPLSYAAVLGGACTLIGTSTNLVVAGLLHSYADVRLGLFEITRLGVPCAILGIGYVLLVSRWLLPDRRPPISAQLDERAYQVEMVVSDKGPLVGKSIESAGLRHLPGLYLAHVERNGKVLSAVAPDQLLEARDLLGFVGALESVVDLNRVEGLTPAPGQLEKLDTPRERRSLFEVVISNSSPLLGRSIRGGRFRNRYGAVVIAVARGGTRLGGKLGDIVLRSGDTLLLEAPATFWEENRNSRDFFLVSAVPDSQPHRHDRAWISLTILAAMAATASLSLLTMLEASLLAGLAMIATRCVGRSNAGRTIDGQVLLVIAASFALGQALDVTGVAASIAHWTLGLVGDSAPLVLFAAYLVTALFTELISNSGAAVLMFPIAVALADGMGASILPFAMTIMMAASFGFASPIGYQTHLMVYGPGGYRFADFVRIGLPLDLLMAFLVAALAPVFWPL
ncbi:MAG TPA: SLC13 family permease [Trueperaceae bacterium]